jgi:hypothetical protein
MVDGKSATTMGKPSRRELLLRWQEERRQKQVQEKASQKKPFVVGVSKARAHLESGVQTVGTSETSRRVLRTQTKVDPTSPLVTAGKDSRKNLSNVFCSNDIGVASITDMLSMKLDFSKTGPAHPAQSFLHTIPACTCNCSSSSSHV